MQQPLCHLYFLTVMEHMHTQSMKSDNSSIFFYVRYAGFIQQQLRVKNDKNNVVLLWIELQAVIQNLIQELSLYLSPSHPYKLEDVRLNLHEVNKLVLEYT